MSILMNQSRIAFIGGGNMACAMINGLILKGRACDDIMVSEPSPQKGKQLQKRLGVRTTTQAEQALEFANTVVFAVKPQVLDDVLKVMSFTENVDGKLFISVAAGISTQHIKETIGQDVAIVRLMPNMPALVGNGMSGVYANKFTSLDQKEEAVTIAKYFGECLEVYREEDINMVTAISGSGPAYFLEMFEAMISAGIEFGFSREEAQKLTLQTAFGAASLVQKSDRPISELIAQISSPKGTTESALAYLSDNDFSSTVNGAVKAAFDRAMELGQR